MYALKERCPRCYARAELNGASRKDYKTRVCGSCHVEEIILAGIDPWESFPGPLFRRP